MSDLFFVVAAGAATVATGFQMRFMCRQLPVHYYFFNSKMFQLSKCYKHLSRMYSENVFV